MKTEIAYTIITDARNKQKDCIVRTLDGYYSFNFANNNNTRIKYMENLILVDDGESMTFIDCSHIVSIQVTK